MADEPEQDKEVPEPSAGLLARWTSRLADFKKLLAGIAAVVAALAVVIGGVIGIFHLFGGNVAASPSTQTRSSAGSDGSPGPLTSTIPSTTSPPSLSISVTCELPGPVHEGQTTTAAYTITSNEAVKVGIGAGVYDSGRNDQSNGDGDIDAYQLVVGVQTVTRDLALPSGLSADRYEIDAEIWPANEIGTDGVDTLADAVCGSFNVP